MGSLFLTFALLFFQTAPSAVVQGTVVKQGTGEPLSKATVSLPHEDRPRFVATTDADGNFSIPNVTPGEYQLTATRLGYVRAEYGDRASNGCGTPVVLIAGQRLTNARISMWPDSVISGHLYDTDREGMSAVSVSALKYAYENGRRILTIVQTVQTNDLGEFRLFGLPPGRYYVAAALLSTRNAPDGIVSTDQPDALARLLSLEQRVDPRFPGKRFLPVYFPGVDDPQGARAIELRPGESSSGVDITVTLSQTFRVAGKVTNLSLPGGAPSPSVTLLPRFAHPNAGVPVALGPLTPEGTFDIYFVPPGPYYLVLSGVNTGGRFTGRALIDVVDKDVTDVVIDVSPALELKGHIRVDDPAAMQRILQVGLRSLSPIAALTPSSDVAGPVNQTDGSFSLRGITPSDYLPFINYRAGSAGDAALYVKSMRLGSLDARDGIHLDAQPANELEIFIGSNGGKVDGVALDANQKPVAGATVVLVPDIFLRKRSFLYKSRKSDASGRFTFDSIAPGEYKVFAWDEVENRAWEDADFIRPHETRGKAVTVREGSTEQVQISSIPSNGPIYGQCSDPFSLFR